MSIVFDGTSCLGKTTFINCMFNSNLIAKENIDCSLKNIFNTYGSCLWTTNKINVSKCI